MNTFKKDLATFAEGLSRAIGAPVRGGTLMPQPVKVLGQLCQNEAKKSCPRGVGKGGGLMGSIRNETYVNKTGWVAIVGTNQKYGQSVEEGAKPHYVDPEDLVLWCMRVLGLSGEDAVSASYAVSKKIQKHGTKPQPYLLPGCELGYKKWLARYGK